MYIRLWIHDNSFALLDCESKQKHQHLWLIVLYINEHDKFKAQSQDNCMEPHNM
jgi:hypothetical protein